MKKKDIKLMQTSKESEIEETNIVRRRKVYISNYDRRLDRKRKKQYIEQELNESW